MAAVEQIPLQSHPYDSQHAGRIAAAAILPDWSCCNLMIACTLLLLHCLRVSSLHIFGTILMPDYVLSTANLADKQPKSTTTAPALTLGLSDCRGPEHGTHHIRALLLCSMPNAGMQHTTTCCTGRLQAQPEVEIIRKRCPSTGHYCCAQTMPIHGNIAASES